MIMSMYCRWLALASVAWLVAAESPEEKLIQQQCRLWMGPSATSTEDSPKLGLFAGVDYDKNDIVGHPEIAIPLIDFVEEWNRRTKLDSRILNLLEGYLWTPEYAGAKWESDHSAVMMIPGHGVLANYHSGSFNVDWSQASALLRTPPEVPAPGVAHPSRGAITPYYNLTITATKPIKAGMEIFANFGDVWDGNTTEDVFQDRLTRNDYDEADKVLAKILEFMDKYRDQMTPELADEVLDFIMGKILDTAADGRAKAIRSLIPAHPGKLQAVKDMGGTFHYRNPDLVKSKKWLVKHATCVDNLKSGPSTIPEAGRGAFATRKLPRGTIIAPMPMLQIPDKDIMDMYEMNPGDEEPDFDKGPVGKQLVVNYCFGHPESNMLLLPVGKMVNLINHQPKGKANAKVRWARNKDWGLSTDWHDEYPKDLADYHFIGVVMEVVATRDIEEGEEVFIDYGKEWAAEWDSYMEEWDSQFKANPTWPLKADDMKVKHATLPFKTREELEAEPYPKGVMTVCFIEWTEVDDGRPRETADGIEIAKFSGPTEFKKYSGLKMFDCEVIERTEKLDDGFLYNYTVVGDMQIENVPHAAITFVDKPYQGSIHIKGAFRHPIGIPDGIFPQAWRDLRE